MTTSNFELKVRFHKAFSYEYITIERAHELVDIKRQLGLSPELPFFNGTNATRILIKINDEGNYVYQPLTTDEDTAIYTPIVISKARLRLMKDKLSPIESLELFYERASLESTTPWRLDRIAKEIRAQYNGDPQFKLIGSLPPLDRQNTGITHVEYHGPHHMLSYGSLRIQTSGVPYAFANQHGCLDLQTLSNANVLAITANDKPIWDLYLKVSSILSIRPDHITGIIERANKCDNELRFES